MSLKFPSTNSLLAGDPHFEIPNDLKAGIMTTDDGVNLRYAIHNPFMSADAKQQCRGTVCLVQGRGDFIERYYETIQDLADIGYAAAIIDYRGQGGSDRLLDDTIKGHIKSFRQYDLDLENFMNRLVLPDCPPPYFAIGHSTGANIVLRAVRKHIWFSKVVLTTPLLELYQTKIPRSVIRFIARTARLPFVSRLYVPGQMQRLMEEKDFPGNNLTSDITRYKRDCRILANAPQLGVAGPTIGWLNAAITAMDEVWTLKDKCDLLARVLIIAAGRDEIIDTEACRIFSRSVPGVACVVINESKHDILRERDEVRLQFWAAFQSFIDDDENTQIPSENATTSSNKL